MFSTFFINRPIFATVLSILIVIAGLVSLRGLPVEQYPTITPPTVVVRASYPGANASTIADMVGTPIEQQVNGVEGMLYMSSTEVWTKLIPLIRMTEMYYIIAETATDETEALDALNTVLFNRGVKELEDKTQLAGMLRDEYRREFFGEGQLFFYYKRLNVKVLHSYSENADLDMDAAKYVVPLPLSETDFR